MTTDIYGFFRDSIVIMLVWFLLATSFFIWGRFFSKLLKIKITGKIGIVANIWLGWVFSIFLFAIYNLFLPINVFTSSLFYIPAIIVFFVRYSKKIPNLIKSISQIKIVAIILTLFVASTVAIQLPMNFDTGLYHFNNIRWANEYHIIKGLGNLHTRLGFNQLFFLYAASLNFHPFFNDYAFHVANSFLYALFFITMVIGSTSLDLILLCLFFFIPMPYFWINNPTPDMASTLIQIVIFRFFIEVIYYKKENKWNYLAFVAVLTTILISLKLSNGLFALGLGLISLLIIKRYPLEKNDRNIIKHVVVFMFLYFFVWVIRGYIQTGYPLFPSKIGYINFDWKVPSVLAEQTEKKIYAYARLNNYDYNSPLLKDWGWIDSWLKESFFNPDNDFGNNWITNIYTVILMIFFPMLMIYWGISSLTLLVLSSILFSIWFWALLSKKNIWKNSETLIYLYITEITSILFWFFVAPNPRFANAIFIILFANSLLLVKQAYPYLKIGKKGKDFLLFFSFFMFIVCFYNDYSANEFMISKMYVLKKLPMNEYKTKTGLKILVPANGEQPWDSNLPATPEPEANLALRGSNLDDGFYIKE